MKSSASQGCVPHKVCEAGGYRQKRQRGHALASERGLDLNAVVTDVITKGLDWQ